MIFQLQETYQMRKLIGAIMLGGIAFWFIERTSNESFLVIGGITLIVLLWVAHAEKARPQKRKRLLAEMELIVSDLSDAVESMKGHLRAGHAITFCDVLGTVGGIVERIDRLKAEYFPGDEEWQSALRNMEEKIRPLSDALAGLYNEAQTIPHFAQILEQRRSVEQLAIQQAAQHAELVGMQEKIARQQTQQTAIAKKERRTRIWKNLTG